MFALLTIRPLPSRLAASTYSYSRFCTAACTRTRENRFVLLLVLTDVGSNAFGLKQNFVLGHIKKCVLLLLLTTRDTPLVLVLMTMYSHQGAVRGAAPCSHKSVTNEQSPPHPVAFTGYAPKTTIPSTAFPHEAFFIVLDKELFFRLFTSLSCWLFFGCKVFKSLLLFYMTLLSVLIL